MLSSAKVYYDGKTLHNKESIILFIARCGLRPESALPQNKYEAAALGLVLMLTAPNESSLREVEGAVKQIVQPILDESPEVVSWILMQVFECHDWDPELGKVLESIYGDGEQ